MSPAVLARTLGLDTLWRVFVAGRTALAAYAQGRSESLECCHQLASVVEYWRVLPHQSPLKRLRGAVVF